MITSGAAAKHATCQDAKREMSVPYVAARGVSAQVEFRESLCFSPTRVTGVPKAS
jgi:hypothetical protein